MICAPLTTHRILMFPLVLLGIPLSVAAQNESKIAAVAVEPPKAEAAKAKPPKADAKPAGATAKAAKGVLRIETTLAGVLESGAMKEVALVPQEWAALVVAEAVAAGTRVAKGDVILRLDTTKLDEQIRDLEAGQGLAELTFKQAQEDLQVYLQTAPIEGELIARNHKQHEEDFAYFNQVELPQLKKIADQRLKQSEQQLEYTQEELKQLEKMYKADDLTEETEQIVLKRARNDVEQVKFAVESQRLEHDRQMKTELPRQIENHERAHKLAELTFAKSSALHPLLVNQQRLTVEKLKYERLKAQEHLAALKADRELLTVKAPADGVVYYGRCAAGKWSSAELAAKLRRGGSIAAHEVVMTIVGDDKLFVRAVVPEKELANVQPGAAGKMTATAHPISKLAVRVRELSPLPVSDGNFEARLELVNNPPLPLVAGMACELKIVAYFNAEAILIPTKAIFADELDDDKRFVYLADKDGKHAKRPVIVGHVKGDNTEIADGLSAGDLVLLEKPAE